MHKAYFNWSTGKDSALALYKTLQHKTYKIDLLVTTINKDFNRVSMHGLRNELLYAQVKSIGIPLKTIAFSAKVTMDDYSEIMEENMSSLVLENYTHSVFGDIFLEDLKKYRDTKLTQVGIKGVYPLWKKDTKHIINEFLNLGFKAITVCVNATLLGKEFVGRIIDEQFLEELPESVDVCGENGEFHTFVFDGPLFSKPIPFKIGEKVLRSYTLNENDKDSNHNSTDQEMKSFNTYFWYCDLALE
ncbi:diphthine--ammonia ligase [Polaribacter sp. WD7]|uniref:Dph6-related ATP pyrophosphatase n=1 Tax=Polaribacter sp. WD7 TaxID=2269061 RepID=UPI000DF28896|nr:diphthine--ammonia ligase [Polaribacter sp. WD7]RCS27412.1 diphthine--ammonia ligase [Polaribacter sp. WD7]